MPAAFNARSARGSVVRLSTSRVGRDGSGARHVASRGCTGLRGCAGVHVGHSSRAVLASTWRPSHGRGGTGAGEDLDGLAELGVQLRIVLLEHLEKLLRSECLVIRQAASFSNSFV